MTPKRFKQVFVTSVDDLPKEAGTYFCNRSGFMTVQKFTPNPPEKSWMREIRWYLIEEPETLTKEIKLYDPKLHKPNQSKEDIRFSEDVFIIDENGMHGLAFYSFEDEEWNFHTETLVDYNESGAETKWKWYYPVVNSLTTSDTKKQSDNQ